MANITYADKDKSASNGINNLWRDVDANEVKEVVNSKFDKPDVGKYVTIHCGNCDLSTNAFPTGGGTGSAGAIQQGNRFFNTAASTTLLGEDGGIIPARVFIEAKVNTPGQDPANWAIFITQA